MPKETLSFFWTEWTKFHPTFEWAEFTRKEKNSDDLQLTVNDDNTPHGGCAYTTRRRRRPGHPTRTTLTAVNKQRRIIARV